MTSKRIQSIDELDFEWEIQSYTWEKCRLQLVDFKEKFLHTKVPPRYAENMSLATWVKDQKGHSTSGSKSIKRVT